MTIAQYIDQDERRRTACPVCESSDGVQLSSGRRRQGPDTGFAYCHACHWRGDGIDYLKAGGMTHREAMDALGIDLRAVKAGEAAMVELARRSQARKARERRQQDHDAVRLACQDLVTVRSALSREERQLWHVTGELPERLLDRPDTAQALSGIQHRAENW